jgi:hypothetical protein
VSLIFQLVIQLKSCTHYAQCHTSRSLTEFLNAMFKHDGLIASTDLTLYSNSECLSSPCSVCYLVKFNHASALFNEVAVIELLNSLHASSVIHRLSKCS